MAEQLTNEQMKALALARARQRLQEKNVSRGTTPSNMTPFVAEATGALNRGLTSIPDFVIGGLNAPLEAAGLPQIPSTLDTLRLIEPRFGGQDFMEPGLARDITQAGGEVTGSFLPSIVSAAPQVAREIGSRVAPVGRRLIEQASPSIERLKQSASVLYKQIDDMGIRLNQSSVQGLLDDVSTSMRRAGHNTSVTPRAQGIIDDLAEKAGQETVPLSDVEIVRRVAGNVGGSPDAAERNVARVAIERIDDFLDAIPEDQLGREAGAIYRQARGLTQRAKKGEAIEELLRKAEIDEANIGLERALKNQFRSFLKNKKNLRGFTDDEIKALRDVVDPGPLEQTLAGLGKFGFDTNQALHVFAPTAGAIIGTVAAGPAGGVAVPAVGSAARIMARRITQNNASLASALLRAGKDARRVASAYAKNIPKGQRSAEDLAALFMNQGIDKIPEKVLGPGNTLFRDAAFILGLMVNAPEANLADGGNEQESGQSDEAGPQP